MITRRQRAKQQTLLQRMGIADSSDSSDDDDGTFLESSPNAADDGSVSLVSKRLLGVERPPQPQQDATLSDDDDDESSVAPPAPPSRGNVAPVAVDKRQRREFLDTPPEQFVRNVAPPWAPPLTDKDARELVAWQRREIDSQADLYEQPWYQFALLLAGRAHIPIDRLVKIRTRLPPVERPPPLRSVQFVAEYAEESEDVQQRRVPEKAPNPQKPATPSKRILFKPSEAVIDRQVAIAVTEPKASGYAFLSEDWFSSQSDALDWLRSEYPGTFGYVADVRQLSESDSTKSLFASLAATSLFSSRYQSQRTPVPVSLSNYYVHERARILDEFRFVRRYNARDHANPLARPVAKSEIPRSAIFVYDSRQRAEHLQRRMAIVPECRDLQRPSGRGLLSLGAALAADPLGRFGSNGV